MDYLLSIEYSNVDYFALSIENSNVLLLLCECYLSHNNNKTFSVNCLLSIEYSNVLLLLFVNATYPFCVNATYPFSVDYLLSIEYSNATYPFSVDYLLSIEYSNVLLLLLCECYLSLLCGFLLLLLCECYLYSVDYLLSIEYSNVLLLLCECYLFPSLWITY